MLVIRILLSVKQKWVNVYEIWFVNNIFILGRFYSALQRTMFVTGCNYGPRQHRWYCLAHNLAHEIINRDLVCIFRCLTSIDFFQFFLPLCGTVKHGSRFTVFIGNYNARNMFNQDTLPNKKIKYIHKNHIKRHNLKSMLKQIQDRS